jgi:DinB superfamily
MNPTLQRLQLEIAFSLNGLDATQTQLQPRSSPNKWNIQQIMEHLLLTYSGTEMALNARLTKGTPTRAKPSIPQHLGQYTLIHLGYFPRGRKAPPLVTPAAPTAHPLCGEDLTQAAADHLAQLDLLCAEAEQLFGTTCRCASHMVLGPLRVDQWRKFQLIHGEHHLKQILAIRKAHSV